MLKKKQQNTKQEVVTGIFDDEVQLMSAISAIKKGGSKILDVHTPFPVHGLDKLLNLPQNEGLSRIGFAAGIIGVIMGFGMQALISVKFYPINFGGKPFLALPSFMPVIVMLTFMLSAFAIAFGFLAKSGLGAGAPSLVIDEDTTNDRFLVILEGGANAELAAVLLTEVGAQNVQTNEIQITR